MGDISEMRGLIVVGCFLFMATFLISGIYTDFGYPTTENRELTIPEYFEALDLGSFTVTHNFTINNGYHFETDWALGGYHWDFLAVGGGGMWLSKRNYWWIIWTSSTYMKFKNEQGIDRGTKLTASILDADYNTETNMLKYICQGDGAPEVGCTIFFAFNTSDYDKPSEAWTGGELYFLQGMGLEQISTTMNAWNIIGSILWFQMPNTNWIVNAIIAVPLWICIAYISFILILRALGAIFGGGA